MKQLATNYKQRASQAGIFLTRGGVESKTVQSYLQEKVKEEIYGVKKEFSSKYTDKGLKVEDSAIDYAIEQLRLPFAMKNEQHFENDYFTGTPDVILEDEILDIKCSWDCFTFPLFIDTIMKSEDVPLAEYRNYYCQLQIYMHLTGKRKARLVYVLMNTPDDVAKWEVKHDYSNVSGRYRIKTFEIDYNEDCVMELQQGVIDARKYIEKLTAALSA